MTVIKRDLSSTSPKEDTQNAIIDHMLTITPLSDEEMQVIMASIPIKTFKKGTILLREGQIANECYFIIKGCVRQYYLKDGEEKTTFFYTEEQSVATTTSQGIQTPVQYYLECVEESTLSVLTIEKELELYKQFPRFESICRVEVEKQVGQYKEMLASYITTTPEERYRNLLEERPDLLHRVPQYQLASYLGVKPESLSRIRKRILAKSGKE